MQLVPKDLGRMGGTTYFPSGKTSFVCEGSTSNIEAILIREIITPMGYRIISEEDCIGIDNYDGFIEVFTDMPREVYEAIMKGEEK